MTRAVLTVAAAVAFASSLSAQSLADLAKKTAADREKAKAATSEQKDGKDTAPAAKTYTDADLKTLAPMPSDVHPAAPARAADTPAATAATATSTPADTTLMPTTGPQAEAYWKDRMRALQTRLNVDDNQLTAALARLADYETELAKSERAVNGEVYVDRALKIQAMATRDEVSRLRATVASDRSQVFALQEEARRADVPPGWLR